MYRAGGVAIDDRPELWVHAGGRDVLEQFGERFGFRDMFDRVFTVREYAPGAAVRGGRVRGDARSGSRTTPSRRTGSGSSADGTTIAYSGDSGPSERLVELARDTDLFVCEATLDHGVDDGQPRGHLSVDEALAAAAEAGTRRVLLTHRPAELVVPPGIERAYDGLELEL